MALMQIAEPGMSAAPHEHRLAVGIDLGTTNSLVATVRSADTQVLADESGRKILPSIVRYLADGSVDVGYKAQAAQSEDAANTIASVKRFMGRAAGDLHDIENLSYAFGQESGNVGGFEVTFALRFSSSTASGPPSPLGKANPPNPR